MELKKPTTFDEQVKLLEKKNILIKDKNACIDFLSKTNYYRLTGYYLPFIRKEEEKCFIRLDFARIQNIITTCISENSNTLVVKHHNEH